MPRPSKLERQYKHVLESLLDRGKPLAIAERVAAAVVNKHRAKLAKSRKGPKLVGKGGSRRQWYPGKGRLTGKKGKKKRFYCLAHKRRFKSGAGLSSHYRAHKGRRG